jgi:ABC-2 type transport system ATP-binding protein
MENIILEVKNLTKKFGSFTAVDNLSFSIKDGEILGLLGPNGAGKTTTIQMLLGVMEPTVGSIAYFGKTFKKYRTQILKDINFSSTYISLPWQYTITEILNIFARLYGVGNKDKRIQKLLEEFEIDHLQKKSFLDLSSGEKTRVLLAKAFLNYPKIILLDEPTASLDVDIAVKVRQFLKRQKREYNVSMLFTSHNMPEVEEICDRILILNNGTVIAQDTPNNLTHLMTDCEIEFFIEQDVKKANTLFKKIEIPVKQDGNIFKITIDEKAISDFLALLVKEKIHYERISINKPDLEDYFLHIIKKEKK